MRPWARRRKWLASSTSLKLVVTQFPLLRILWKWNKVSYAEFGRRFKNPLLREAFPLLFTPDFSMSFLLMTLGWLHNKAAAYPIGGSLEFSRAIEKRYLVARRRNEL